MGIAAAALASALLFSSFGQNPGGIADALAAMVHATKRAGGQGHEKPPSAYLAWLLDPSLRSRPYCGWTLAAFGLVGAWSAWQRRRDEPLPVFMGLFALLVLAVYSAIPYKTPWLLLNALAPWALIAGIGFNKVCAALKGDLRVALACALVAGVTGLLASETWRLCFVFPADPGNPLAYSPTSPDIRRLEARVEGLVSEGGSRAPIVAVVGSDIWPLPWYLRHCPNVGYWPELPRSPEATVVISEAAQSERVSRALGPGWRSEIFGLRPEVLAALFHRAPGESGIGRKGP
jgi:predicted membrane-bound mannosyltransferase